MNATGERWSSIPGFEGLYEVSDLGQVKSLSRTVQKGPGRQRYWRAK